MPGRSAVTRGTSPAVSERRLAEGTTARSSSVPGMLTPRRVADLSDRLRYLPATEAPAIPPRGSFHPIALVVYPSTVDFSVPYQ